MAFLGGGLAATLLLHGLRTAFPRRVVVIDPWPTLEQPPVHWSYWSVGPTPYDRFAVGIWLCARVADAPPEPIAPFALRLVRSTTVLAAMDESLGDLPIERLRATALSVRMRADGLYEVETTVGAVRASWVFDSACGVEPTFPSPRRPRAVLSGTGLRVEASGPTFDEGVATLFDPLHERGFAYLLPLSLTEALLESASFGPEGMGEDRESLLRYLRSCYPGADFSISHSEYGTIPLRFAPARTVGAPRPDRRQARLGQAERRLWRGSDRRRLRTLGPPLETASAAAAEPAVTPTVASARRGFCAASCQRSTAADGVAGPRDGRNTPRPVAKLHKREAAGQRFRAAHVVSLSRRAWQSPRVVAEELGDLLREDGRRAQVQG